ncbi:MAG: DUF2249 domain-containing protein [Deltaproteobacteria bacterium]|nr:DUF2249 domain-containing protein [Deltaproteobacteria bacterium]MBI3079325.1 DUF2249 domain-containing protein [Deltaproteobacteria bacterium]
MGGQVKTIDCRNLMPPEPLVRAMKAVEELGPEDTLVMLNDRAPMLLYPRLEERGLTHQTEQAPEGHYIITIRRAPAR